MASPFIGTVEKKYSVERNENYLEIDRGGLPLLGVEDPKVKNTYHLSLNIESLLEKVMQEKVSKEKVNVPSIPINRCINCGVLRFRVTKTGKRMFKGQVFDDPVNCWEDLSIKHFYHMVRDFNKLDEIKKDDHKVVEKAEVEVEEPTAVRPSPPKIESKAKV